MIVKTMEYNDAAFYLSFGGTLKQILGDYPDNLFEVEVPRWVLWYGQVFDWVPRKKFIVKRNYLKREARIKAGLPARFTGDHRTGFRLEDVAYVKQ